MIDSAVMLGFRSGSSMVVMMVMAVFGSRLCLLMCMTGTCTKCLSQLHLWRQTISSGGDSLWRNHLRADARSATGPLCWRSKVIPITITLADGGALRTRQRPRARTGLYG